ncbi:MAG: AMP-binding protein [Flavobacteriales bacterium]|nr:AMP-binding protein [Flavobacteriales bacterium]
MRFNIITGAFEDGGHAAAKAAVIGSDRVLSWAALREESEALSQRIDALALPAGEPVLLRGHKQAGFVAAIVACISSNRPYVPLDSVVPLERVRRIRAVTGASLLIDFMEEPALGVAPRTWCGADEQLSEAEPLHGLVPDRPHDPIRYIIFTSGSTGEPKGVRITREAASAFLDWMSNDFGFTSDDVFVNQAPFSFDLSVYELFTSLHVGSTLLLNDAETAKDAPRFLQRARAHGGSVWVSTPTFAYLYLTDPGFVGAELPGLRHFLFCGEALPKATAQRLLDRFPRARVLNTYGPTEATVATTLIDVTHGVLDRYADMPVGSPKRNCVIHCRTHDGHPATKESPGEIEIIGRHVSIGYLNNDALNAEKFFMHDGQRGFRTGDYGWFDDGILFFTGRRDEQVKLNGFRIELGDIAASMLRVPGVADAIAVPLRSGDQVKRIVGFARPMPDADETELTNAIRQRLLTELPAYMVPAEIMLVEAFPVNSSHKTDRQALIARYLKRPRS